MAAKTRINVEVTAADIERAHIGDSSSCVVAQAVARTVKDAMRIDVDIQAIRFTRSDGNRYLYLTPYAVQGYIIAFDAGEDIEPFTFHLRDPTKIARKNRSEPARAAETAARRARRAAEQAKAAGDPNPPDPGRAAKAAYAEARAAYPGDMRKFDTDKPKPPPRVFKRKTRTYGHRVLRINKDTQGLGDEGGG